MEEKKSSLKTQLLKGRTLVERIPFNIRYTLGLLLVGFLAYGMYLGQVGFYWDEWPFLWFNHAFGQSGVLEYFAHNRPYWGYLYAVTLPILGTSTIAWHIFGLVLRCLSGLCLYWVLHLIWPTRTWAAAAAGIIFILYPSFSQQSISLMYGHFWIVLICCLLSLGFMIKSTRASRKKGGWTVAALVTSAVNLFCMEYFFGLELLRPILLWIVLTETIPSRKIRFGAVCKHYLPYFLLVLVYLYWRIAIFQFPTYQPSLQDPAHPLQSFGSLLVTTMVNIYTTTLQTWVGVVSPALPADFGSRSHLLYWILVVVSFFVVTTLLARIQPAARLRQSQPWTSMLWLSLAALLLAGIPFLITSLKVSLDFPSDRFTLPYMVGGSLLVVGLIMLLPENRIYQSILVGMFACFAVGQQFIHTNQYQHDWNIQKDFFWQLYWRAPALQPGTTILTEDIPQLFESDNSLTAPLNWTYAPDFSGGDLPYLFGFVSVRTETGVLNLEPNQPIHQNYKVVDFYGNTSQSLVLDYTPPGCLHILDPERDQNLPMLPEEIKNALPLSDPSRVIASGDPAVQPLSFLGEEPAHGWCYYFEKAELARASGNWQQVAHLGDQALSLDDYPNDTSERIVFLEGYAHTGEYQKALRQTRQIHQIDPNLDKMLCATWNRIHKSMDLNSDALQAYTEAMQLGGCSLPGETSR